MKEQEKNKELCEKYPFLVSRNVFSDEIISEDFESTILDQMPDGWRVSFGEKLCQELKEALDKSNLLKEYRILQIKEKFGGLRWYSNFDIDETAEIINKYEEFSRRTCIRCGKPATRITLGWICPYCDECIADFKGKSISIEEYFKELEEEV